MRHIICAAILAVAAGLAQAGTWDYSYRGFYDPATASYLPDAVLTGTFTGNDDDGNGVIALDELTDFATDGADFFGDFCTIPLGVRCTVKSFSYRLTGELAYSTEWQYQDEGIFQIISTVTGGSHTEFSVFPNGETGSRVLEWTDETMFSITPPPIPEPSMAAMSIAGLLLAGAGMRRRCAGVARR